MQSLRFIGANSCVARRSDVRTRQQRCAPRYQSVVTRWSPLNDWSHKEDNGSDDENARTLATSPEPEEVGLVIEEAASSTHGLFTEQFKSVLAESLKRQGVKSLYSSNRDRERQEDRISPQEEVLQAALITAKQNVVRMQHMQSELDKAIAAEMKQIERMQFALEKARRDAAYYKSLQTMMESNSD